MNSEKDELGAFLLGMFLGLAFANIIVRGFHHVERRHLAEKLVLLHEIERLKKEKANDSREEDEAPAA